MQKLTSCSWRHVLVQTGRLSRVLLLRESRKELPVPGCFMGWDLGVVEFPLKSRLGHMCNQTNESHGQISTDTKLRGCYATSWVLEAREKGLKYARSVLSSIALELTGLALLDFLHCYCLYMGQAVTFLDQQPDPGWTLTLSMPCSHINSFNINNVPFTTLHILQMDCYGCNTS